MGATVTYSGDGSNRRREPNSFSYDDVPNTTVITSGASEARSVRVLRCSCCFTGSYTELVHIHLTFESNTVVPITNNGSSSELCPADGVGLTGNGLTVDWDVYTPCFMKAAEGITCSEFVDTAITSAPPGTRLDKDGSEGRTEFTSSDKTCAVESRMSLST